MDDWEGTGWSDAKEQDWLDAWARRMRRCPLKRCRRTGTCRRRQDVGCPALAAHPIDPEVAARYKVALYRSLKRDVAYADAHGDAAIDAICAERDVRHAKQVRLAWERAKKEGRGSRE